MNTQRMHITFYLGPDQSADKINLKLQLLKLIVTDVKKIEDGIKIETVKNDKTFNQIKIFTFRDMSELDGYCSGLKNGGLSVKKTYFFKVVGKEMIPVKKADAFDIGDYYAIVVVEPLLNEPNSAR